MRREAQAAPLRPELDEAGDVPSTALTLAPSPFVLSVAPLRLRPRYARPTLRVSGRALPPGAKGDRR
jgi:hypothetical protein